MSDANNEVILEPGNDAMANEPPPIQPQVPQPPYLILANAMENPEVHKIAELASMRVASLIMHAQGAKIPGEADDLVVTPEFTQMRMALALKVLGRKLPRDLLTIALLQVPDVAMALASDQSNFPTVMTTVNLSDAWTRNWNDFALIVHMTSS